MFDFEGLSGHTSQCACAAGWGAPTRAACLLLALMAILSKSLLALVRRHFVSLMLLSVGHSYLVLVNNYG